MPTLAVIFMFALAAFWPTPVPIHAPTGTDYLKCCEGHFLLGTCGYEYQSGSRKYFCSSGMGVTYRCCGHETAEEAEADLKKNCGYC